MVKKVNNPYLSVYLWFFITIPLSFSGLAQKIKVIDKDSGKPIEHVTVYTENGSSILTDKNGIANLEGFKKYNVLYFQHPAYVNKSIPKIESSDELFVVDLTERIINIDEIVISATKWEQAKDDVPNKIVAITPSQTEFNNPQTAADLLASSGQVFIQKSQLGGGSPMIRGFAANSVLIVVDGIRMNNAIFRSGNLQNVISIDPNILDKAEVVFGPGSVIYGSDALGGVMNFSTKALKFSSQKKLLTLGNAFIRTSTANNEKTFHADVNIAGKRFSALTSITASQYDDLKTGSQRSSDFPDFGKRKFYVETIGGEDRIVTNRDENVQVGSGYDQLNVLQKFGYKLNKNITLGYSFNFSTTSDIPRYDRLIETDDNGLPIMSEWYYGPQNWMMHSLKAKIINGQGFFDKATITLGYQNVEESRNSRNYQDPLLSVRTENVDIFTSNFDFNKTISHRSKLFYGFEGLYNKVNSSAFRRNIVDGTISSLSTRYPSGGSDYTSLATYASLQHRFSQRLTVNAGIRFSFVALTARVNDEDILDLEFDKLDIANGALNGSLGLVYSPNEKWSINWITSTGFRAPNVDDVGKVFDGANGIVTVPNPDLKPEYSHNTELTIERTFGKSLQFSGTGFVTYLNNAIVQRDFTFNGQDSILFGGELSAVEALVNAGGAVIYGGSLSLIWDISPKFSFASSLTVTTGEDLRNNEPLRHTTPAFTKSRLQFKSKKFKGELSIITSAGRAFENLAPSERNKTHLYTSDGALAWQTLNFKSAYTFNETFQITGGVENIFDQHYRPYSSGISAPGRNFSLALRVNF